MPAPVKSRTPRVGTPLISRAAERAREHRRAREQNRTEVAEDYVEVIAELIDTLGEARAVDVARRLGVSHVTVVHTVRRLRRDGWVTAEPYRSIFLTEAGRRLATESRRRHAVVVEFLAALGVPEAVARADAEGLEHHVSAETLAAFERYLKSGRAARPARRGRAGGDALEPGRGAGAS